MRSTRTSSAPIAAHTRSKGAHTHRRSLRVSSAQTAQAKSTPPLSPAKTAKAVGNPAKKVSKPFKPVAIAPKPRTKHDEDSPRLAWTAATRVQSPLRSSEEISLPPPAALAVVGPPKSSPFVKRTPLFIQRHVHPEPALQPGKTPSFSSARIILYQPHPSAFASPRLNKRTRELEGASGRSTAKQGKNTAKRAKIAKPSSTLNLLKPPTARERSSSLSSLSSLDASDSDLTSLDSSDEGEGVAKERRPASRARARAVLAPSRTQPQFPPTSQAGPSARPQSLSMAPTSFSNLASKSTDEVYATLQGELEVLRRQNARRIAASIEALSSSFKSSKPSLTASPALSTKPLPSPRQPKPHPPSHDAVPLASTSKLRTLSDASIARTRPAPLQVAPRLSPKSKGKGKVEVISVITVDEESGEESEDEVVLCPSLKRGELNGCAGGSKGVSFAPLPAPALDVDDSEDESVEGDWEEVSEDEYYRSQAGSSTFRDQETQ